MAKGKVNPRRRPLNGADVIRAAHKARDEAVIYCWSIFFSVMRDKEGADTETLRRIWDEISDLSDSITKGYVDINDLRNTLRTEDGVVIK